MDVEGHLSSAARRLRAAAHRHPHADIAMAGVVYTVTLLTTAAGSPGHHLDTAAGGVAALACVALVDRQRWPYLAFVVSACAAEVYLVMYGGDQGSMVLAAPLIALYTVADRGSRRRAMTVGGIAILTLAGVHMVLLPSARLGADNVALAALGALAVAAGDASRSRRAYLAEVEARAQRAERNRESEAARRVTEERLRIARDLHDVVGHHLALINVQAAVAAHVLESQPDQSREALTHIRDASKTALHELRDTIGLLRQPDEQITPTEPTCGLAGLAELLASFRRSGLPVDQRVDGAVRPIAVATDLTVYRVVQESLTNVCKHAGSAAATVHLRYKAAELQVIIDNEAAPCGAARNNGGGNGIVGMRERVAALGGTLSAGPRTGGGYRVMVKLPLPQEGLR